MGASYNNARNRMDEIIDVLGGEHEPATPGGLVPANNAPKRAILDRLGAGELSFEEAMKQMRGIA